MKIGIVMGSDSDLKVMRKAMDTLKSFGISYEVAIASAHRTPKDVQDFVKTVEKEGGVAIIAGAGAAAHLPGVVASMTTLPVVGVPIDATALKGMDALLAIVQMPSGMPVATMAIDGAKNAALFCVQICATQDKELETAYKNYRHQMAEQVRHKNAKLQDELSVSNLL